MIVEMFERGTNFKVHIANHWQVKQIKFDGGMYVLCYDDESKNTVLNAERVELRIS